jgi:ribosome-associated toxin RatA of RatAB toxin-antitoxin module
MNTSIAKVVTFTLALAGSACLPPVATAAAETPHAPAGSTAAPAEAPRIEAFAVRDTSIERLRVTVNVAAPVERVRAVIFDYAHYPEFMPRYEKAAVLRIAPDGGRLVRMDLGGIVRLWMRVEISPPVQRGATEAYEGRLVGGNVKAFVPRWELTPLADGRTRVMVESFMDPGLPLVPSSLINSGARDGMREAAIALKARIEGPAAR